MPMRRTVTSSADFFHPYITVTDEPVGEPCRPAVHLKRDRALVRQPLLGVFPLHNLNAVDPGRNGRWVAGDASAKLVPAAVLPDLRPVFGLEGEGKGGTGFFGDLVRRLVSLEVHRDEPADPFTIY